MGDAAAGAMSDLLAVGKVGRLALGMGYTDVGFAPAPAGAGATYSTAAR